MTAAENPAAPPDPDSVLYFRRECDQLIVSLMNLALRVRERDPEAHEAAMRVLNAASDVVRMRTELAPYFKDESRFVTGRAP